MSKKTVNTNPTTEVVATQFTAFNLERQGEKVANVTINNLDLIDHTQRIQAYRATAKAGVLGVCYELGVIDSTSLYEKAGFRSLAQYAETLFDYKRSTVELYSRIGQHFVEVDENGVPRVSWPELQGFSVGQLQELLKVYANKGTDGTIKQLLADGKISALHSTKEIRNAVQTALGIETKSKTKDDNDDKEDKGDKGDSQSTNTEVDGHAETLADKAAVAMQALQSILEDGQFAQWPDNAKETINNALQLVAKLAN